VSCLSKPSTRFDTCPFFNVFRLIGEFLRSFSSHRRNAVFDLESNRRIILHIRPPVLSTQKTKGTSNVHHIHRAIDRSLNRNEQCVVLYQAWRGTRNEKKPIPLLVRHWSSPSKVFLFPSITREQETTDVNRQCRCEVNREGNSRPFLSS
jgi:hypothetical protein